MNIKKLSIFACIIFMTASVIAATPAATSPAAVSRGLIGQGPWLFCADQEGMMHILYRDLPFIHGFGVFSGLNGYTRPDDLEMTAYTRGEGTVTYKGKVRGQDISFEQTASIDGNRVKITIKRGGSARWPAGTWGGIQISLPQTFFLGKKYKADSKEYAYPEKYDANYQFPGGLKKVETDPAEPGKNIVFECEKGIGLADHRKFDSPNYILSLPIPMNPGETVEFYVTFPSLPDNSGWDKGSVRWSYIGYPLKAQKFVILEWPRNIKRPGDTARLEDRSGKTIMTGKFGETLAVDWIQNNYAVYDFSELAVAGEYRVSWSGGKTAFFKVSPSVFEDKLWQPTLDYFIPFLMCHANVDLGTNITGHGLCHNDDAERVQANYTGPDGFVSYECAGTPYKAGDHVPLNLGGWHDAGDFDLNVPAQSFVTWLLALTWEEFKPLRDVSTVDMKARKFTAGVPDGIPDILQQVEWGVLWLLSVQQKDGMVWMGVCEKPAQRYGKPLETITDGIPGDADDRQIYVDNHPDLQLNHVIAMAASARVLKERNPDLSAKCLDSAKKGLKYFLTHKQVYRPGSYTATPPGKDAEIVDASVIAAAAELYITTREQSYLALIKKLSGSLADLKLGWPGPEDTSTGGFRYVPPFLARLVPLLKDTGSAEDVEFKKTIVNFCHKAAWLYTSRMSGQPWPLNEWHFGKWGNSTQALSRVFDTYWLTRIDAAALPPSRPLRNMLWLFGLHPVSDTVFITGLGYPETKYLYNIHLQALKGFVPASVPGAVIPGMGGFWYAGVATYIDEYGYYSHNEACIYTQAQYIFAINAMKAMGF